MKTSATCVLSATLLLSSCAHMKGIHHAEYTDKEKDATPTQGYPINDEPSTRYEDKKLEERELTAEIVSALGVENLATVIAFDFKGNPIAFDRNNDLSDLEVEYPVIASALLNAFGITVVSFKGSHCVDRIDTLGNARRICTPPHN